jgi:hypothetical protein
MAKVMSAPRANDTRIMKDMMSTPRWLRCRCQVHVDATKAEGADVGDEGARCVGRRIVYRGPELLHLVITFRIERSFTERLNGSNSMEHQLLVVK